MLEVKLVLRIRTVLPIVIDCPPSLDDIPLIGLCAATHYLTPAMPAYFSLKSLRKTAELTEAIQREAGMNPTLKYLGTYFTDYILSCAIISTRPLWR